MPPKESSRKGSRERKTPDSGVPSRDRSRPASPKPAGESPPRKKTRVKEPSPPTGISGSLPIRSRSWAGSNDGSGMLGVARGAHAPIGSARSVGDLRGQSIRRTGSSSSLASNKSTGPNKGVSRQSTLTSQLGFQKTSPKWTVFEVDQPNGGTPYLLDGKKNPRTASTVPFDRSQQEAFIDLQGRRPGLNQARIAEADRENAGRRREGKPERKLTSSQTVIRKGDKYEFGRSSQFPGASDPSAVHSEIEAHRKLTAGRTALPKKKSEPAPIRADNISSTYEPCDDCDPYIRKNVKPSSDGRGFFVTSPRSRSQSGMTHNEGMDDVADRLRRQHLSDDQDRQLLLETEEEEEEEEEQQDPDDMPGPSDPAKRHRPGRK